MTIRLEFKPQDCWIGVFWKYTDFPVFRSRFGWEVPPRRIYDVWICLVPCFPIHVQWWVTWKAGRWHRVPMAAKR